ncbi:hypothetical protein HDE_07861 [Halotydeus destructor]|nr:hypothetical protein HDE_07861 [Halotydeus destructor]
MSAKMEPPTKCSKILLTATSFLTFMAMGVGMGLQNSILDDMEHQLGTSMRSISFANSTKSIGSAISCIIAGPLLKYLNRHLVMAAALVVSMVGMAAIPFVQTIEQYHVTLFFCGLSFGPIQVCLNILIVKIWDTKGNVFLQVMHTCLMVGATVGPMLAKPFHYLAPLVEANVTTMVYLDDVTTTEGQLMVTTEVTPGDAGGNLVIPMAIGCLIQLVMVVVQVGFLVFAPYKDDQPVVAEKGKGNDVSDADKLMSNRSYFYTIIASACIILCFEGGIEINVGAYIQTFAVHINDEIFTPEASDLGSTFFAVFAASRLVNIFLAAILKPGTMISLDLVLIVLGNAIIFFTAQTSVTWLWVGAMTTAIGFASCWPCVFSFVQERIPVSDNISALFSFCTIVHVTVAPLIQGVYLDEFPMIFAYMNLVSAVIAAMAFLVLVYTDLLRVEYSPVQEFPNERATSVGSYHDIL